MAAARAQQELGIDVQDYIPPHVFRYVERELYDYPIHKAAVEDYERKRQDILHRMRQWPEQDGGRPQGVISDPTGDSVIRLEALEVRTRRARQNVEVVESVLRMLSSEQRELVRLKYFNPEPMTNEQVAATMSMGLTRFYELRREVIRKFALRMGLL